METLFQRFWPLKPSGKKVFAASQANGRELAKVVDAFIPLRKEWFHGLAIETN